MDPAALCEALIALARECGIAVRRIRPALDATPGLTSGPARVRGAPCVALVDGEPPSAHAAALALALARFAAPSLEGRYLPPAVRACLEEALSREAR